MWRVCWNELSHVSCWYLDEYMWVVASELQPSDPFTVMSDSSSIMVVNCNFTDSNSPLTAWLVVWLMNVILLCVSSSAYTSFSHCRLASVETQTGTTVDVAEYSCLLLVCRAQQMDWPFLWHGSLQVLYSVFCQFSGSIFSLLVVSSLKLRTDIDDPSWMVRGLVSFYFWQS